MPGHLATIDNDPKPSFGEAGLTQSVDIALQIGRVTKPDRPLMPGERETRQNAQHGIDGTSAFIVMAQLVLRG